MGSTLLDTKLAVSDGAKKKLDEAALQQFRNNRAGVIGNSGSPIIPETITFQGRTVPFPKKGALVNVDNIADRLEFHFNPPELSQDLSSIWSDKNAPGYDLPIQQWSSGGAHTVTLKLFFLDFWRQDENIINVEKCLQWLFAKRVPDPASKGRFKSPSLLHFMWNGNSLTGKTAEEESFSLRTLKVDRTQFDLDLVTIRATVDITLAEFLTLGGGGKGGSK